MANNQDNHNETEGKGNEPSEEKVTIVTKVTGKVKWFNVKRGYGFVCRNDNQEDVFIHQSAIVKNNPEHPRKSVGEGEEILFDIVKGAKGNEAANVSGANGECVKGSEYALRFSRGRGRGGYRGRGNRGAGGGRPRGGRSRGSSGGDGGISSGQREFYRGGPPRGRPFRGGRPYVVQYRNQYNYDMPPPPPPTQMYYEYDYYRGPMRGRGGMRGGRMMRGGPPREMMMNFTPFGDPSGGEFYDRRPRGGRGRFRRRSRGGRGGRGGGRGLPRGGGRRPGGEKDEGEEQQHENDVLNDQQD